MNNASRIGRTWVVLSVLAALAACVAAPAFGQDVDPAAKALMGANGLYQRKMYKLAAEEYEVFLTKYPKHAETADAMYGAASCYYQMQQYPQAIKHLRVLADDKKFKLRDEALAVLGHCLLSGKDYKGALEIFDRLLDDFPKSKHAEVVSINRAQVLFLLDRPKDSLKACEKFLKDYKDSSRRGSAEYFLACSQAALGESGDAEKTLQKFLKNEKDSPHAVDATLLLGQSLENQGQLDEAARQYRKFIEIAPEARKGDGYYSVGLVEYKNKKYGPAVDALSMVVTRYDKSPYVGAARLQLGLAQLAAGQAGDARATLQKVAAGDKERAAKAGYWLIQCDMAERKFAEARTQLDKLYEAAKGDPKAENMEAIAYDRALCGMEVKQFGPAGQEFADFIDKFPKSAQVPDATYRQAFCLHKQGQYPASQKLCQGLLEKSGSPMAAATKELAAENLFLMGEHEKAARMFNELLPGAKGAQRNQYMLRLGQCDFLAGRYEKAVSMLSPVAAEVKGSGDPQFQDAAFLLGDAQFQAGQFAEAAKTLEGYLSGGGSRKQEGAFKLGLAQLKADKAADAQKTFARLVEEPVGSPWVARGMLAYGQMLYRQLNKPDKAAELLEKMLTPAANAPKDLLAPATWVLAWIDYDAKKYEPAAAKFGTIVSKYSQDALVPEAALQQAICLKEAGKLDEALAILRPYEDRYPAAKRKAEAKQLAATILAKTNKSGEAVKLLASLADSDGTCTDTVLYELAWAHRDAKANARAIEAYRKLVKKFPGSKLAAPARVELAGLLYLDKKYDESAKLAQEVIDDKAAEPKIRTAAQYRLGWCLAETGKQADAARIFVDLVKNSPSDPLVASAKFRAGVCFAAGGDHDQAVTWLKDVIASHSSDDVVPAARLKLGESLAALKEYKASQEAYEAFLDKHKGDKSAYMAMFGIGWALENQRQYDQARSWYVKVTDNSNSPTAARAQFQIGECYFAQKKFEEAAGELIKTAVQYAYPDWQGKALYEAGRAFEALGQTEKAVEQYKDCIEKAPKGSDIATLAKGRLKALKD